jgi:hypothetical protein
MRCRRQRKLNSYATLSVWVFCCNPFAILEEGNSLLTVIGVFGIDSSP